jgi:hypothetical protein
MLALLLVAIGIGVLCPRPAVVSLVSAPLILVALVTAERSCPDCSYGEVSNPYRMPELVLLLVLVHVARRWHRVRPRPIPVLRRLAGYASGIVVAFTAGTLAESHDVADCVRAVVGGATLLVACLGLELRLHVPPLPAATIVARASELPRARIGS